MIRISKTISALKNTGGFGNVETVDSVSLHTCDRQKLHNLPASTVEILVNTTIATLLTKVGETETVRQKDIAGCREVIVTALYSEAKQELEEGWGKVRIDISTDIGGVSFICKHDDGEGHDLPESLVSDDVVVLQKCDFVSKTFKGRYVFFEKSGGGGEFDFIVRPAGNI